MRAVGDACNSATCRTVILGIHCHAWKCIPRIFSCTSARQLSGKTTMWDDVKFWDGFAAEYAASPIKDEEQYADTIVRIRKHLVPTSRMLEVGCGTGTSALKLAGDVQHIVATDISPKLVQIASDKGMVPSTENVEFRVADVTQAPGADESYDIVLALDLVMLVPDTDSAIAALKKKLRPGGVFISKTSGMADNFVLRISVSVAQFFGRAPASVRFFSCDELSKKIVDAGMQIVESHDYDDIHKRRFIVAMKPVQ